MPGLLDLLASDDPSMRMGLGLLAAAGPQAQPMSFGQRLAGAVGQFQQQKQQDEERRQRAAMQALQLQQAQQALAQGQFQYQQAQQQATRQQALESLPGQFMTPGQKPPSMDNRDVGQPGEQAVPSQGFDMAGYANAMYKYDPRTALALQAGMRKDNTPIKVGAGESLLDPTTMQALFTNPKEQTPPSSIQEYQFAKAQGYRGSLQQWVTEKARAGAASTTVSLGSPVPVTLPDGSQALVQPANRPGEPPQIMRIPGSQEPLRPPPRETPAALRAKLAENDVSLGKIDQALAAVQAYPQALGLQNVLGDTVQQRLDPKGVDVRALVTDIGSQKLHDRSGAVLTAAEMPRLRPFIPGVNDTPETVKKKLTLFRREYADMQRAINSGATLQQAARPSAASVLDAADAILEVK